MQPFQEARALHYTPIMFIYARPAMKALRLSVLLAFLAAGPLSSCQEDEDVVPVSTVVEQWQWQSGFCGWSGASSPATTGHTEGLLLTANGQATFFKDGAVVSQTRYTLSQRPSMLLQRTVDFISFATPKREVMYVVNNGSLTLSDDVYDGCSKTYGSVPE